MSDEKTDLNRSHMYSGNTLHMNLIIYTSGDEILSAVKQKMCCCARSDDHDHETISYMQCAVGRKKPKYICSSARSTILSTRVVQFSATLSFYSTTYRKRRSFFCTRCHGKQC